MRSLTPRINRIENNLLINGAMELAQRGTSFSVASGSSQYTLDRMFAANVSSSVTLTAAQDAAVPNSQLASSLKLSKTAAGTLAAGTSTGIAYGIEGYDILPLMADTWSAVFWVRSSVASNRSLAVANAGFTHSYVKQYQIAQANTWELKVVTFPGLSTCPGTLNRTNGLGARLFWGAVHGSTYQTGSLSQWVAGDFRSGTGEDTTWLTGTTHDLYVSGIMILPGDWTGLTSATYRMVRAGRQFEEELSKAQRYYEKSYPHDTIPGATGGTGRITWVTPRGIANGENHFITRFALQKRTSPTVTVYSPSTGASGVIFTSTLGDGTATVIETSDKSFRLQNNAGATITDQSFLEWHYTANAELTLI